MAQRHHIINSEMESQWNSKIPHLYMMFPFKSQFTGNCAASHVWLPKGTPTNAPWSLITALMASAIWSSGVDFSRSNNVWASFGALFWRERWQTIGGTMVEHGETPDIVGDLQIYNSDRDLDQVTNGECQERDHPNPLFLGNLIPGSSKFQVCLNWWLGLYAVPHGTAGSTASMWWIPGLYNRVISGCRVDTGSEYLELHLRRPFVPSICWSFWITSALAIPNGYNIAH